MIDSPVVDCDSMKASVVLRMNCSTEEAVDAPPGDGAEGEWSLRAGQRWQGLESLVRRHAALVPAMGASSGGLWRK